ncbi:MAG: glycosyltransferase [Synergistaceae bacterium]|jgi:glycosyltransferase involved in cell wall biosynthesis|nr:glycosyltransferase [Synergistaceae bacterium]
MISVIMLTYNRETFVARAIESVSAQTFRDFEFIIVDNGSTDRSGAIADEYAAKDERVRVIHRARGNIGSGRNTGLDAVRGEWVTFVDDDDTCEPDFLEFLLNLAETYDADVAVCGAAKLENGQSTLVGVADEPIVMNAETAIVELLWRKRYNNGFPTKLFKRSVFADLMFPETGIYDDIYLMYKMLSNANKVVSFGLPKYNVARHENNNSAATTKHGMVTAAYLDAYRAVYRERTIWLCERFPENSAYWWYFDWSFLISMVEKIIKYNLPDCETHLAEMRHELNGHQEEFIDCRWSLDFEKEWMVKYVPIK